MKVNCNYLPQDIHQRNLSNKVCVVIDVLRATSTVCTALNNGAVKVLFASSIESAQNYVIKNNAEGNLLLAGERNAQKIAGFALGNSPLEFTADKVRNTSVILTTTNGTKAIAHCKHSKAIYTVSLLNLSTTAEVLCLLNEDIEIVCSGTNNDYSIEDSLCAGLLVRELLKYSPETEILDPAKMALALANLYGTNIEDALLNSYHGKILIAKGFECDVKFCARESVMQVVHQVELDDIID